MAILGDPAKDIGRSICEALCLDPTKIRGLDIHLHLGEVSTIDIEYLPDKEMQEIAPILKHYRLELIDG